MSKTYCVKIYCDTQNELNLEPGKVSLHLQPLGKVNLKRKKLISKN